MEKIIRRDSCTVWYRRGFLWWWDQRWSEDLKVNLQLSYGYHQGKVKFALVLCNTLQNTRKVNSCALMQYMAREDREKNWQVFLEDFSYLIILINYVRKEWRVGRYADKTKKKCIVGGYKSSKIWGRVFPLFPFMLDQRSKDFLFTVCLFTRFFCAIKLAHSRFPPVSFHIHGPMSKKSTMDS